MIFLKSSYKCLQLKKLRLRKVLPKASSESCTSSTMQHLLVFFFSLLSFLLVLRETRVCAYLCKPQICTYTLTHLCMHDHTCPNTVLNLKKKHKDQESGDLIFMPIALLINFSELCYLEKVTYSLCVYAPPF